MVYFVLLQVNDLGTLLMADAASDHWGSTKEQAVHFFTHSSNSIKLSSRMHLLTLLIQELEVPCITVLQENDFINMVLTLISSCMPGLQLAGTAGTPQYVELQHVLSIVFFLAYVGFIKQFDVILKVVDVHYANHRSM